MGYLYFNFSYNLNRGSKNKDDFYTMSLVDQYEALKPKLWQYNQDTFQNFIETACPKINKYYYISLPAFDRRIRQNDRKKDCIYNIVIRPEKSSYMARYIPNQFDLIIIGDVTFGKVIDITVKGIDLIDANVAKFGEKSVNCSALCAFFEKEISSQGRNISVPDFGEYELHDSVITNDFINSLCTELYPVPDPQHALYTFDKWQQYMKFRRYYLGKQSERCTQIDDVIVCDSYMITKEVYRRNEAYSAFLLDGIEDFARGEQIILYKNVDGADEFPLIKVVIDKNRKNVLSDVENKSGKRKPKFEVWLSRYTNESMGLSPTEPKYDENGDLPTDSKFFQYTLGERYLFTHIDIEPDCTELDKQCESAIKDEYETIDNKYAGIIRGELVKFIEVQTATLRAQYKQRFEQYKQEVEASLDKDVTENKDKEVKREYEAEIEKKLIPLIEELNNNYEKIDDIQKQRKAEEKKDKSNDFFDLEAEKDKLKKEFEDQKHIVEQSVSLRVLYIARNEKLIETKKKSLEIELQAELDKIKKEKQSQLEKQYKGDVDSEKANVKEQLSQKLKEQKAEKIENETVRRYCIYFRPAEVNEKVSDLNKEIEKCLPKFLTYDNRAEKAKIERQEKALNSFLCGYVKNPYLPAYLFAPEALAQTPRALEKDPDWYLESLNDRQKLAVKRALASESLFLLQGPPGTGKTQVIAEITAQLCKRGKKVLISSETHKAIDNVFERLPKIPEIRPLRLIPSLNGRESNYSPERLVDNFYANISGNLERQISKFEHFEETRETFDEEMKNLRLEYEKLLRLKSNFYKVENKRSALDQEIKHLNDELQRLREELMVKREELDDYEKTIKHIEECRLTTDGVIEKYICDFSQRLKELLSKYSCFKDVPCERVEALKKTDITTVKEELSYILSGDKLVELQKKQKILRSEVAALLDQDTLETPKENDDNYKEFKRKQTELISINNEIKNLKNEKNFNLSDSIIYALVPEIIQDEMLLSRLPSELVSFQSDLRTLISETEYSLKDEMKECSAQERKMSDDINEKLIEISQNKREYEQLGKNSGIEEYNERYSSLKQNITRFFRDFFIVKEYDSENLETAFDIIRDEWNKLENDYNSYQKDNKTKISTYRAICKYLTQDDILEEDRKAYTRDLFNNVNVFGITCTSRDRFMATQLNELAKYGIKSVDIRMQGIDVVIIDEVSKSSFLDLLIPILYGKTVILVGDHRQLPPMYDLRHLCESDFEGLDEEIITKEKNKEYTMLYEECFFKTLYEKVPEDFRIMLNKQYRCHSHIMEVFNHFYGGKQKGLTIGKQQQDDEKQHNLTVRINDNTIIDPMHYIYFVDCEERESSAYEGSTSKVNEQETEVAITLLKELNKASENLVKSGKIKVVPEKNIDERPSAGIICTYGDQAGLIKNKRKYAQFKGFSGKQDEKLIISTVDDFQGDERDIIIVSMVRNPVPGRKFDLEFIKKFERINVALSRARKLLIIVGAKKFLSENGIIDIPDMEGHRELDKINYPVFREIIETVKFRGKVLTANDILGESYGK